MAKKIEAKCPKCGGRKFEAGPEPTSDDEAVCVRCGFRAKIEDEEFAASTALDEIDKSFSKTFRDLD